MCTCTTRAFSMGVMLAMLGAAQQAAGQSEDRGLVPSQVTVEYFPLSIGNTWTYGSPWYPAFSRTATVFDSMRIANRLYYLYSGGPLDLIGSHPLAADTIRVDSEGKVWQYARGQEWMLFQFSGGSFVSHTPYPESTVVRVVTGLTDTVPAAPFKNCISLYFHRSFDDESVGYVFAPGVGIIKWYGPFYAEEVLLRAFVEGRVISDVNYRCSESPERYELHQNYPNPFNPSTTIKYELPTASIVRLGVYDMLGREVSVLVDEVRNAGVHEVKFEGGTLSSGVYFYRLQAGDYVATKRLLLLR
jgi:hypothetical protein